MEEIEIDDGTRTGFENARERLEDGDPVLFDNGASKQFDLPGINDPEGMRHAGFGMFVKKTPDGEFRYSGGGAMVHEGNVSWTPVTGDHDAFFNHVEYDIDVVLETVEEILD